MKVWSEGTAPGTSKNYGVELSDTDLPPDVREGKTLTELHRLLTNKADAMIVDVMYRRGDISRDFAEQRLREISGKS